MISDLVPFDDHPVQKGLCFRPAVLDSRPDDEEGRLGADFGEEIENDRREGRVRAVVEGEGDAPLVRPGPGDSDLAGKRLGAGDGEEQEAAVRKEMPRRRRVIFRVIIAESW